MPDFDRLNIPAKVANQDHISMSDTDISHNYGYPKRSNPTCGLLFIVLFLVLSVMFCGHIIQEYIRNFCSNPINSTEGICTGQKPTNSYNCKWSNTSDSPHLLSEFCTLLRKGVWNCLTRGNPDLVHCRRSSYHWDTLHTSRGTKTNNFISFCFYIIEDKQNYSNN